MHHRQIDPVHFPVVPKQVDQETRQVPQLGSSISAKPDTWTPCGRRRKPAYLIYNTGSRSKVIQVADPKLNARPKALPENNEALDFRYPLLYTHPDYLRSINLGRLSKMEVTDLALPDETLKAMIRDYHGFELSDEELAIVRPELDYYLEELQKLEDLDLSDVFSSRLLRLPEAPE